MNFVTFVFSLLLIFSFGTVVMLEKKSGDQRLRETYLGHLLANRKILSMCERNTYESLRSRSKEPIKKEQRTQEKHLPSTNPECAKLNLFPLIHEGKEQHPFLYQAALKLFDTFYGKTLFSSTEQNVLFLNAFLKKGKEAIQKNQFSLEKLSMDSSFQFCYYKMLKGTKSWDLEKSNTYPSLLDVIKVEEGGTKVCICHAHEGQLKALFGSKVGSLLFREIHSEEDPSISDQMIEEMYAKSHMISPKEELFHLIDTEKKNHLLRGKETLIASDTSSGVMLRKNIYREKKSLSR